jgi:hypothetical protein
MPVYNSDTAPVESGNKSQSAQVYEIMCVACSVIRATNWLIGYDQMTMAGPYRNSWSADFLPFAKVTMARS